VGSNAEECFWHNTKLRAPLEEIRCLYQRGLVAIYNCLGVRWRLCRLGVNTHVRKNVEDFGKFWASSVGTDDGLWTNPGRDAMIPEEKVTTRKPF
jgi:hypothetical protein